MGFNRLEKLINENKFEELERLLNKSTDHFGWNYAIDECLKKGKRDNAKKYIDILVNATTISLTQRPKAIANAMGALYDAKEFSLLNDYLKLDLIDSLSLETKDLKHDVLLELAYVFTEKKDLERAKVYYRKYVYRMIQLENNEYVGNDIYYSFRGISSYTLKDLINNTITLSSPYTFNDPIDSLIYEAFHLKLKDKESMSDHDRLFKEALEQIRIRCFATPKDGKEPYFKTLMWAHYADSHKGICIKYRFSRSFPKEKDKCVGRFGIVKYPEKAVNVQKDKYEFKECFLTKQKEWEYENEARLIYVDTDNTSNFLSLELEPNVCSIEAVYFGRKCSETDIFTIMNILKGKDVTFWKMDFNPENIFEMKENEIKIE